MFVYGEKNTLWQITTVSKHTNGCRVPARFLTSLKITFIFIISDVSTISLFQRFSYHQIRFTCYEFDDGVN